MAGLDLRVRSSGRSDDDGDVRESSSRFRLLTFSLMAYGPPMAMLPTMLEQDRRNAGWSVGQTAWRLDVSVRKY